MVCDAHLSILQLHAGGFGAGSLGQMALLILCVVQYREAFHGLGV
jgi:hypothetical protein